MTNKQDDRELNRNAYFLGMMGRASNEPQEKGLEHYAQNSPDFEDYIKGWNEQDLQMKGENPNT